MDDLESGRGSLGRHIQRSSAEVDSWPAWMQPRYEMTAAEPRLNFVTITLCDLCLDGAGGECYTPGCALWISAAPDIPLRERAEIETSPIRGVVSALVDAFKRGEKLFYTGRLIVTDPDTPATVQMVLDEDDFAHLEYLDEKHQRSDG